MSKRFYIAAAILLLFMIASLMLIVAIITREVVTDEGWTHDSSSIKSTNQAVETAIHATETPGQTNEQAFIDLEVTQF